MEYIKIEGQFPKFSNCAVTLGKFDGIHRGHRKLIQKILEHKKEYGTTSVVVAFVSDRHHRGREETASRRYGRGCPSGMPVE